MHLPISHNKEPSLERRIALVHIGFDLSTLEKQGETYYAKLPDNPSLRCEKKIIDGSKDVYNLYFKETLVLRLTHEKSLALPHKVGFSVDKSVMLAASLTDFSELEPFAGVDVASSEAELSKHLQAILKQVFDILYHGGVEAGLSVDIPVYLRELRRLKELNPELHDAVIASNSDYQSLLLQFPGWKITRKQEDELARRKDDVIEIYDKLGPEWQTTINQLNELADRNEPATEILRKMGIDFTDPKARPIISQFGFIARLASEGADAKNRVMIIAIGASKLAAKAGAGSTLPKP